ncbi:MAG TPA: YscO family type III secretion system apparatus protein [Geminicoccaceae bacterium]|nr:YscO family type III secretion system apparatus protein [Geminicoccaceae bacterium]
MNGPPTVLLRVKGAREQTAMRQLHEARAAVARAQQQLDAKREEYQRYRAWRPQRERELYDEIQNQQVSLADLDELKAKVVQLRDREQALLDEVGALERALDAAGQAQREAHAAWLAAQREVQKVEELLADWQARAQRQGERLAELELEEFTRPGRAAGH